MTLLPFIQVPDSAQSIRTGSGTSLCSLSRLSLPSTPHSLFLYKPFRNKTMNLSLLPAQTVSAKQGPLPGQVGVCRHRTVTPNPVLVNPESFMEASQSAGALSLAARSLLNWGLQSLHGHLQPHLPVLGLLQLVLELLFEVLAPFPSFCRASPCCAFIFRSFIVLRISSILSLLLLVFLGMAFVLACTVIVPLASM